MKSEMVGAFKRTEDFVTIQEVRQHLTRGGDGWSLYITAETGIYRIGTNVPGA